MTTLGTRYGRDELEWEELRATAIDFLRDRARLERTTSYTELNSVLASRTGYRRFDFATDRDRAAMGQLLGECTEHTYDELGAMISAIVIYLNENDAGTGFYRLAVQMGLLPPKPSSDARTTFWAGQVAAVYAACR